MARRGVRWCVIRTVVVTVALTCWADAAVGQAPVAPEDLIKEADRLAWLRAWARAEPLYEQAQRVFVARGDRRNALYSEIGRLRGQLSRLPAPEVSNRLAAYLDDAIVKSDDRLRLRCLVVKGETDEDLDPSIAERSWAEALQLAEKLQDHAVANRARGELGVVAFLRGDIGASVIALGQALKVAVDTGDVAAQVRWMTLFGHGYTELNRPEQALDYYDRALKLATTVHDLPFPLMTYLGKGDAFVRMGRYPDAARLLSTALDVAIAQGALGYQAELTLKQGQIARQQHQREAALDLLTRAADLANRAGGERLVAEADMELAAVHRELGRPAEAERALRDGIDRTRRIGEHLLLGRLLAQLADASISARRYAEADVWLEEASDILEGLLTSANSPWLRSRVIGGMDDVLLTRIRLAGRRGDPARTFSAVEQARARSLLELLLAKPLGSFRKPPEMEAGERRISALQLRLLKATSRAQRQRLLDDIFAAEEQLAPVSTELFDRTRTAVRRTFTLREVQRTLRTDEILLECALDEPASYCVTVSRTAAQLHRLVGKGEIDRAVTAFSNAVQSGQDAAAEARSLSALLLNPIPEIARRKRLIVSVDAGLNGVPFELLITPAGDRLLTSHVISYVPSASVLAVLRTRPPRLQSAGRVLAISASSDTELPTAPDGPSSAATGVERGVYDLDPTNLSPLQFANDEARAVGQALGPDRSTVLVGPQAIESTVKALPLRDYTVLHFAVHGLISTRFPARSALLLNPAGGDDGLLQAREILSLRLGPQLVTLSACDTAAGAEHGQEGVTSLVRPFIAAGAVAVVANLWNADDRFSLTLMRQFYSGLASGLDVGDALRAAKLKMIEQFGPAAVPRLWGGVVAYGDSTLAIADAAANRN